MEDYRKNDNEEAGLRSEEVQEVMDRRPHWMCRWGMTLVGVLAALLVGAASLIDYADALQLPAAALTAELAAPLSAPQAGRIVVPPRGEGERVARGDTLALLHTAGDTLALRAPAAGRAYACDLFAPGDAVAAGERLLLVLRDPPRGFACRAYVTAAQRARLAEGLPAEVHAGAAVCRGTVTRIAPLPQPATGRYAVTLRFAAPTPAQALALLGDSVTVRIPLHDQSLLQAILRRQWFAPR